MIDSKTAMILVAVMAIVSYLIRLVPFLIFRGKETPKYITYLGEVLPFAIMGMLLVYCLKDVHPLSGTHGIPELIAVVGTALLHIWKRNVLLSLVVGTVGYMVLVQLVFA